MVPGFVLKVSRKRYASFFSMFIFNLSCRAFLKKEEKGEGSSLSNGVVGGKNIEFHLSIYSVNVYWAPGVRNTAAL